LFQGNCNKTKHYSLIRTHYKDEFSLKHGFPGNINKQLISLVKITVLTQKYDHKLKSNDLITFAHATVPNT